MKSPTYSDGSPNTMLARYLINYNDQKFIKRVCARARAAKIMIVILAQETFQPPLLHDGQHPHLAAIDTFVRQSTNILSIPTGPNNEFMRICDGIYVSLSLVANEKLAKDKEATHGKAQA